MKRKWVMIAAVTLIAVALVATGCTADGDTEPTATSSVTVQNEEIANDDFGAKSALTKEDLTIEEMLRYAIQDEYLARQEYESIMEEYGEQKPFSNIITAEETHIGLLTDIYDAYGYDLPEDEALDHLVLPESLEAAFDIGVQAEIDNIAMYELFLEQDLPEDIRDVFTELRDGSVNHLAAFEKGVRRNTEN